MTDKLYAKDLAACPSVFCATRDDKAPLFTAKAWTDDKIQEINLEDYRGKWVLLFFYASNFTFV